LAKYRRDRVQETMRNELSQIIKRDLKDPRLGFVTITDVELSNDMSHAKVFVSVYGSEEEKQSSMVALENAKGFIRSNLGQRVRLRIVPELVFKIDNSIERGTRILELIIDANRSMHKDVSEQTYREDDSEWIARLI